MQVSSSSEEDAHHLAIPYICWMVITLYRHGPVPDIRQWSSFSKSVFRDCKQGLPMTQDFHSHDAGRPHRAGDRATPAAERPVPTSDS